MTAQTDDKPKPPEAAKTLPWLSSLAEGQRRAAADRKPMLIRVGASWCGPCRKLDAEIEKPSVQAELARWTLVYLDADKAEEEAAELNVTGVPALRIRTMLGEAVAAQDGFLSAEDLVSWLKKQYEAAAAEADEVLLTDDEPDAAAVVRLVRQFQQRNPAIREAAIRRLAPYPQKARLEVVRAFVEGSLSRRLAALELLQQWRAPIADLDPWQPQSLTKERIAALNLWAEKYQPPRRACARGQESSRSRRWPRPAAISTACSRPTPSDAEAIRHRLAGYGAALLPEVTARLKETAADDAAAAAVGPPLSPGRRRFAGPPLAGRPGAAGRLRSPPSPAGRRRIGPPGLGRRSAAAGRVVQRQRSAGPRVQPAGAAEHRRQGNDGRAGEAALRSGAERPRRRAQAARREARCEHHPQAGRIPQDREGRRPAGPRDSLLAGGGRGAGHAGPDPHAAPRELAGPRRGLRGPGQDAGDAIRHVRQRRARDSGENLQVEVYAAMLDLLADADAFVVSRAVEGLSSADMVVAVEPLVRAAAKHPDLAPKIVEMLAQGQKMRVAALPHLRKFRKDADPQVRAAALAGLCTVLPSEMGDEVAAGLQDPSDKVRIAAAQVCFQTMEAQRSSMVQQLQQRSARRAMPFDGDDDVRRVVRTRSGLFRNLPLSSAASRISSPRRSEA